MCRSALQTTARRRTGTRTSGRNHRGQGRRGLTLVELLVAMSIMLVGIYAVAAGFPALFGTLESERVRTQMARLTEARMERLKTTPSDAPAAITGFSPIDGSLVPTELYPDETETPVPANPRDDLISILGETFEAPRPQEDPNNPGTYYSVYPLAMGLASSHVEVNRVQQLQRVDVGQPLNNDDDFRINADGTVEAPAGFDEIRVDYVWVDDAGIPHGVRGEVVENGGAVAASYVTTPAFVNVMPELSSAEGLNAYAVAVGDSTTLAPGYAVLDSRFGATLLLPADDAGETFEVSYQLATQQDLVGYDRRAPIMMEEIAAPTDSSYLDDDPATDPVYVVDLAFRGIDDETALFTNDLTGAPIDPDDGYPVYVLIVDTETGETWTDLNDWISLDFVEGRLRISWDPPGDLGDDDGRPTASEARGRDLRIYYRTMAEHTVVVQKAPDAYVEGLVVDAAADASAAGYVGDFANPDLVDYRTYQLVTDPTDASYGRLLFPRSAAGQMVMVDYMLMDGSTVTRRVTGELHTIAPTDDPDVFAVTLHEPVPTDGTMGVVSVQGVSMTVRGWWHDERGRVQMTGLNAFLAPDPRL